MNKQGRLGLGLWDRLVLFVVWVVTCGLVYLLGFYVGKGTDGRTVGVADRVVSLPVTSTPPAAGQRPKTESELTFYDRLAAGERAASPTPPASPRSPAPPEPAASAPPRPTPRPPAATPAPPVARAPTAATTPAPPVSPPAPTVSPPAPAARSGGGAWTVLASPTRNRTEAEDLQRQLRGKGYDASVVRVARDGDAWYRVQIGRFGSAAQASEVMQRLREREGVSHVFVAAE